MAGTDGRRERGERTRNNILLATAELLGSGNLRPTAWQVARQAGVSRRLVFHHFGRLDRLIGLAAELQAARLGSLVAAIPPDGPLRARIAAICRQRRELYETFGPVHRATWRGQVASPEWADALGRQRLLLREQLEATLAPEIGGRGREGDRFVDVIEHTTSWQYWCGLRSEGGYSPRAAEQALVSVVTDLLKATRVSR